MIGVSEGFHEAAFGQVICPTIRLAASFDKELLDGGLFTLDQSALDGPDLLSFAANDAATQAWDYYNYKDYSDRLVAASWERSLAFPYQIQSAMADFTVSNTDGFFTPLNPQSSIGENNLPARPVKLAAGFRYPGSTEIVPQLVGITDGLATVHNDSKTVDYHVVDFLYDICNQPLKTVINMRDARTDQVIAAILESYGLSAAQYSLARGRFTIPFVFFDIGASVGDALKQLVQSENGFMWLDERGIVRFETTLSNGNDLEVVAHLSDYQIMSITPGELSDIVNHVKITAEVREVQEWQEVYTKSDSTEDVSASLWVVPANGALEMSCGLGDPCYEVVAPTLGKASSVSWFTAVDDHLKPVTSGITATGVLSSNAYKVTFKNNHAFPVEIAEMKLWGEPAKVYDVLNYEAYDDESLAKYGDQLLDISDNQFFQTYRQANLFARTLIRQHSTYTRTLKVDIKGDFSFQIADLIEIGVPGGQYNGVYQITGIAYQYDNNALRTTLSLNGTSIEPGMFTLDISKLNGEDKLG